MEQMDYEPTTTQRWIHIRDRLYSCTICNFVSADRAQHHVCYSISLPKAILNEDYANDFVQTSLDNRMFCLVCLICVPDNKKAASRHVRTDKHKKNTTSNEKGIQATIEKSNCVKQIFVITCNKVHMKCNLCEVFILIKNSVWLENHISSEEHKKKCTHENIEPTSVASMQNEEKIRKMFERINQIDRETITARYSDESEKCQYFCLICDDFLPSQLDISEHLTMKKHTNNIKINGISANDFHKRIAKICMVDQIPMGIFARESEFKFFLRELFPQFEPPYQTQLRRLVPTIHDESLSDLRDKISHDFIVVSTDGYKDTQGRGVQNVKISSLQPNIGPYTISYYMTKGAKGKDYALNVVDALKNFYGKDFEQMKDRVLIFATDSAGNMAGAYTALIKAHGFNRLLHTGCAAHALHNFSKDIWSHWPNLRSLIDEVKLIFRFRPKRKLIFKNMQNDEKNWIDVPRPVSLPPEPMEIRMGNYISSTKYYSKAKNLKALELALIEILKQEVNRTDDSFEPDPTKPQYSIKRMTVDEERKLINKIIMRVRDEDGQLKKIASFVYNAFKFIPEAIVKFEKTHMHVQDSIKIIQDARIELGKLKGRDDLFGKFDARFD